MYYVYYGSSTAKYSLFIEANFQLQSMHVRISMHVHDTAYTVIRPMHAANAANAAYAACAACTHHASNTSNDLLMSAHAVPTKSPLLLPLLCISLTPANAELPTSVFLNGIYSDLWPI